MPRVSFRRGRTKEVDELLYGHQSYIESMKPTFVCSYCGFRKSERHGRLAKKSPFGPVEMVCISCIKDSGLLILPEEK